MTDVYKLIEDIKNSESPYIEDILAALRRLTLAEKVVGAARPMLDAVMDRHGENNLFDDPSTWIHDAGLYGVTHAYSDALELRTSLSAYDAAAQEGT